MMEKWFLAPILFVLALLIILLWPSKPAIPVYGYKNHIVDEDTLLYRFLEPVHVKRNCSYPLVLFLHGAGERGSDNEKQLTHGTTIFLEPENAKRYPCFVVAPQCPEGKRWVEAPWNETIHHMPEKASESISLVKDLLDYLMEKYPVDPHRIYITGLSMGGFGTWDLLMRWPDYFAAAAPICGGGDTSQAEIIKNIPVWFFHSADDRAVPVELSRNMALALERVGADYRYTEYDDAGHASWKPAYADPDLLNWMFKQEFDR